MKKILMLFLMSLLLFGCSANTEEGMGVEGETASTLTMDSFVSAYQDEGIEVTTDEKPAYGMIGATDGVIFYIDNGPVKIYEYDSEESLAEAEENFPMIKDWDKNGLFVLETSDEEAKEIFNNVE